MVSDLQIPRPTTTDLADRPLNIAFLAPEDRQTGTYFRFHNFAIALGQLGHRVTVYSQTNGNRLRTTRDVRDGVPYVFAPSVPGNSLVIAPVNPGNVARRMFARVPPADVYHLFQPYPSSAIPWLALRRRRSGIFVYDWDDFWINDDFGLKNPRTFNERWTSFCLRRLEPYLPRRCDLLTTLSHGLENLARRLGSPRTQIIYNGVWPETPLPRDEARQIVGLRPDAFYAGIMGWSGEMRWTFDGLRSAMKQNPRLRLACIGQDPTTILREFPEVHERVDSLGYLPASKMLAYRSALDLGLIPMASTEFNAYRLPYKLTDFLAAGTPVLASAIGETVVLAGRVPGIACCEPTREAWIENFGRTVAMMSARDTPERIDPSRLVADFSWANVTNKLVAAYRATRTSKVAAT